MAGILLIVHMIPFLFLNADILYNKLCPEFWPILNIVLTTTGLAVLILYSILAFKINIPMSPYVCNFALFTQQITLLSTDLTDSKLLKMTNLIINCNAILIITVLICQ